MTWFRERFFYVAAWVFCRIILTLYNRMTVHGLKESLKHQGPVIIAANHCSNLDPVIIGCAYPRRLRYLAKSSLFKVPFLGLIIRWLGAIPARREEMAGAASALKTLIRLIDSGESVLVFPEGQRSPTGRLQPLEEGTGMLAAKTRCIVIPVFIYGSYEALPRHRSFYKPAKITVYFGKAIEPVKTAGSESSKEIRKAVTKQLEEELRELSEKAGLKTDTH
ncbi:MAG: lysophospholipid acyltransferase family protein [Thermovirgaceae bacterium]